MALPSAFANVLAKKQVASDLPGAAAGAASPTPSTGTGLAGAASQAVKAAMPGTSAAVPAAPSTTMPESKAVQAASQLKTPAAPATPAASSTAAPQGVVDTSGYFNQALGSVDKLDAASKQGAQDGLAAGQRRAATLAALSGRGVGQGYLAGNQQAQLNSQNALTQELAKNESMRQQIYGTQAGQAFQNNQRIYGQQFANDQRVDQNQFGLAGKTADAKANADASKVESSKNDYATAMQKETGLTYGQLNTDEQKMIDAAASGDPAAVEKMHNYLNYVEYTHKHDGKDLTFDQYLAQQDGGQAPNTSRSGNSWVSKTFGS